MVMRCLSCPARKLPPEMVGSGVFIHTNEISLVDCWGNEEMDEKNSDRLRSMCGVFHYLCSQLSVYCESDLR